MTKCSFCGKPVSKGTGVMYIKRDGTVFFFCSKKCEKNILKLGRNPSRFKYTQAGRQRQAQASAEKKPKAAKQKHKG